MKLKFWKYDYEDARKVMVLLEIVGYPDASIIGGIKKKGHSNNDIDIYLPATPYTEFRKQYLLQIFKPAKHQITDWGSLYLEDTIFGTIDIFFKGQTDNFDY